MSQPHIHLYFELLVIQNDNEDYGYNITISSSHLKEIIKYMDFDKIPIFKLLTKKYNIYMSLKTYSDTIDKNVVLVSKELYSYIKYAINDNGAIRIGLINTKIYETENPITIRPLDYKFLTLQEPLELLQNHISNQLRFLYPGQKFYMLGFNQETFDVHEYKFLIEKVNEENTFQIIKAYDTELKVDFNCADLLNKKCLPECLQNNININIKNEHTCICSYTNDIKVKKYCRKHRNLYTGKGGIGETNNGDDDDDENNY